MRFDLYHERRAMLKINHRTNTFRASPRRATGGFSIEPDQNGARIAITVQPAQLSGVGWISFVRWLVR